MQAPTLVLYVSILQILNENGQLNATKIAAKVKINRSLLEQCVRLLVEQGMVSEIDNCNPVIYSISKSGKKVLRFFMLNNSPKIGKILKCAK
jgi:predicted transcriptional regulator